MPILRTIVCEICGAKQTEAKHGDGFPGWGTLGGMAMVEDKTKEKIIEPTLCQVHLAPFAELFIKLYELNRETRNKAKGILLRK